MAKQKTYKEQLLELYGQGQNTGTGTTQTGTGQQSNAMLELILSRQPFSYDAKTDPSAQAARQEAARNAKLATNNTLGSYAGMTGGVPSTAAVSAAAQAGNTALQQGADKVAELQQLAYQNYQAEGDRMNNAWSMLQQQEQNKFDTDLAMAELKMRYGDDSGMRALGVDMSKYNAGGSGGGYYSSGGGSGSGGSGSGGSGGLSAAAKNDLTMAAYDNGGYVPAALWEQYAAQYGEQALIDAGFKKGTAQSGGGSTKKNPTQPAKPGNNMLN